MYLCTGEDPTGGGLGPDFDPETGEYIEDTGEKEQEFKASPVVMESFEDRLDRMIAKLDRIEKSRKGLNNSNLLSLK